MNRYLLFAFDQFYPSGGMDDCVLMSNDWEEIRNKWRALTNDYSYVYDCETGRQYSELEIFNKRFG